MAKDQEFETAQERFWAGDFGEEYLGRNPREGRRAANLALFSQVFRRAAPPASALEVGANMGQNLIALGDLFPGIELAGIEINPAAQERLRELEGVEVHATSALQFEPTRTWELVFTKGVLIHLAPERLGEVYRRMADASSRYLCVVEYYNPTPVSVPYRGHEERLFKRDFAGEIMDAHPQFQLRDYGFVYHRDPCFPMDDVTWFLLERRP